MTRLLVACALLALAGCKRNDMWTQDSQRTWDRSGVFRNASVVRPPVAGTVARDAPDPDVPQPKAISAELLERGRNRFQIFCTGCHGASGDGQGMIVQRGFPHPPELYSEQLRRASAGFLYGVLTNGHGAMYSFASRLPPSDRWAVIAYVRALQASQAADPATLPPEDRAQLEAAR